MDIIASGLQFPEGPIWCDDGSLLLVEIARQTLTRVAADGRTEVVAHVPGGPNGAARGPGGLIYICNNGGFAWNRSGGRWRPAGQADDYVGGRIEVVNPWSGRVERLYDRCGSHRLNGPNDLVFDGHGFWFTDHGKRRPRDMDRGFIFWAAADGSEIRQVAEGLLTPNGIGLSPDRRWLYVSETETGRLWRWEVMEPGALRHAPWPSPNGGHLVFGAGGYCRYDSLAVTASGTVCVATLENRGVAEIAPEGRLVAHHPMPDLMVTNLCFGAENASTAFVTLSHRGEIARIDWHEPGLALDHQRI